MIKKASPVTYIIVVIIAILIIFAAIELTDKNGKKAENIEYDTEYNKCTSICAAIVDEDLATQHLCREKCKRDFLDRINST